MWRTEIAASRKAAGQKERMTNRFTKPAVGLLLGLVLLLGFVSQPAAAATKIPVDLRVVTWKGKIIFDGTVKTGTAKIKPTSTCPTLGGRLGPARTIQGATALGALYQGSFQYKALRPLKISDGDLGFGICGIGGQMAAGKGWWVLRHNYKDAATGAEGVKLKRGDSVLLYYSKSWEDTTPDSLHLNAPKQAKKGAKVKVRVFKYNGTTGKRTPASNAKVSGAQGALTNAQGYTTLTITGKTRLVAREGSLIPSNRVSVSIRK